MRFKTLSGQCGQERQCHIGKWTGLTIRKAKVDRADNKKSQSGQG
jgi:hypothetical protein